MTPVVEDELFQGRRFSRSGGACGCPWAQATSGTSERFTGATARKNGLESTALSTGHEQLAGHVGIGEVRGEAGGREGP
jgi:hypothetical protein